MPDQPGRTPSPRPRRRRTDIDPSFVPPKVPRERRRSMAASGASAAAAAPAPAESVVDGLAEPNAAARYDAAEQAAAEQAAQELAAERAAQEVLVEDDLDATDVITKRVLVGGGLADAGAIAGSEPASDEGDEALVAAVAVTATAGARSGAGAGAGAAGVEATDDGSTPWLPIFGERSTDPAVCPFLHVADADRLLAPIESPDPANRCAALRDVVPQSMRQQELVCLTNAHVNCPRYLRGSAATAEVPPPVVRSRGNLTPAVLGSIIVFIGAFALSIGFVASRGGLEISPRPGASSSAAAIAPSASAAPAGSPSPVATPAASAIPSGSPVATSTPSPSPSPSPLPSATATTAPTSSPTARPTRAPTPKPTSDRYALLVACSDRADCWIYAVRRGDNLFSIAKYFGVPLSRVYAMNPSVRTTGIHPGQQLRLPPPTR